MKDAHQRRLRIGLYRGTTPDFLPVLREVRRRRPEGYIILISPPSYPVEPEAQQLSDEVVYTERDGYSLLQISAAWRLAQQLRTLDLDLFITLYGTVQQQILAVVSGARDAQAYIWTECIIGLPTRWRQLLRKHTVDRLSLYGLRSYYWLRAWLPLLWTSK